MVVNKYMIEELMFPIDGIYTHDVQRWTSVDGGKTYANHGFGKYCRSLEEAERYKTEMEREERMTSYFVRFDVDHEIGGHSVEEYFFRGEGLGSVFHDIMSTTRYYASRNNYIDAWDARANVYNDDSGEYICTVVAAAYNPGIVVYRREA